MVLTKEELNKLEEIRVLIKTRNEIDKKLEELLNDTESS